MNTLDTVQQVPSAVTPRVRRTWIGVSATAAVLASTLLFSQPAAAHFDLADVSPAADAEVASAPSEVSLTYTGEILNAEVFVFSVDCLPVDIDVNGIVQFPEGTNAVTAEQLGCEDYADGDATIDTATVTQAVNAEALPSGDIVVAAQVIYADTHSGAWAFGFTNTAVEATETPTPEATAAPSDQATAEPDTQTTPEPEAEATAAPEPTETAEAEADAESSALPWVIGGIIAVVLIGGGATAMYAIRRAKSKDS